MTADGAHQQGDISEPGHEGCGVIRTAGQLAERLAEIMTPSSAIICIGSELRGDDGAGTAVAEGLAGRVPWTVYNTQIAPESYLMKIVEGQPQSLVVIDAADHGSAPGGMKLIDTLEVDGAGPSTHGASPGVFLALLGRLLPSCRCALLGIQPLATEPGRPISAPVERAVDIIVGTFELLARRQAHP